MNKPHAHEYFFFTVRFVCYMCIGMTVIQKSREYLLMFFSLNIENIEKDVIFFTHTVCVWNTVSFFVFFWSVCTDCSNNYHTHNVIIWSNDSIIFSFKHMFMSMCVDNESCPFYQNNGVYVNSIQFSHSHTHTHTQTSRLFTLGFNRIIIFTAIYYYYYYLYCYTRLYFPSHNSPFFLAIC